LEQKIYYNLIGGIGLFPFILTRWIWSSTHKLCSFTCPNMVCLASKWRLCKSNLLFGVRAIKVLNGLHTCYFWTLISRNHGQQFKIAKDFYSKNMMNYNHPLVWNTKILSYELIYVIIGSLFFQILDLIATSFFNLIKTKNEDFNFVVFKNVFQSLIILHTFKIFYCLNDIDHNNKACA
jgi:hypothetical protein